jgi:PST family polysaccharide transporter
VKGFSFKDVPPKALRKKATRGVAWSFLREGIAEILLFPASMVLARLLTPQEFGIAAAANFFGQLAGRLAELGFNAALVRSKEIRPIHLSTVFVVSLVLGVVKFAALFLAAPLVNAFYEIPEPGNVMRVAAFSFLVGPFAGVPGALLARNFEYKKSATVEATNLIVFSLSSVLLAFLGFSYMSMVYGRLAGSVSVVAMRIAFARWRPSLRFSWSAFREILSFGSGFHVKRILDYTAQNGDNVVVGKLLGMTALGLYDKAFSTMNRFLVRMTGGPGVMFRVFSVIHEEPGRFRRAYQKVVMSSSLLGFSVFAGLIVIAPQLIVVLFGDQWTASADPFRLLCIAGALKLLNTYASSIIQATGRVWAEVWRQLILIALTVGGILAFRSWGPTGAAAAVVLATLVMSVLMHSLLGRIANLSWSGMLRPLTPAVLCAGGVAGVALLVEAALKLPNPTAPPWLLLACQVPLAALFGFAFVLFAPFQELRVVVRDVTRDLAPPFITRQAWAQAYWNKSIEDVETLSA